MRAGALSLVGLLALAGAARAEVSATDIATALRTLGPPGILWGRLAEEVESPDGPWTPLPGVEVRAYPAVAALRDDLERVRRTARDSGTQYETAVARVEQALRSFEAQVETAARNAGIPGPPPVRRARTDTAGVFVFDELPGGPWLIVATRVSPYGSSGTSSVSRLGSRRRDDRGGRFLPGARETLQEAEIWLAVVRVEAGQPSRLIVTDRARWLVGPTRAGDDAKVSQP